MTDDQIYDQLCDLLPTQVEEIIRKAGAPRRHLAAGAIPPAARATELLNWAVQSPANREALVRALEPHVRGRDGGGAVTTIGQSPFAPSSIDVASRTPIVIAVEEQDSPLGEDQLLRTERHVTVTLAARHLQILQDIAGSLSVSQPMATTVEQGRRAWRTLVEAQPRLAKLVEAVAAPAGAQPMAWTGRTALLMRIHPAILIAHIGSSDQVERFLSIECGAGYFAPIVEAGSPLSVPQRSAGALKVATVDAARGNQAPLISEAGASDVALLLADEVTEALRALTDVVGTQGNGFTRVAVALGRVELTSQLVHDVLSRVACLSVGGPRLRQDELIQHLKEGFEGHGGRHAAPCILSAVRRAWFERALRAGDGDAVLATLLWSTWSWIGRPLFAQEFAELAPASYPHLMDLRSVAATGWYFNRSEGIAERYQADALARPDVAPEEQFHLYVSGAGGTGKSCFLRYVYEQLLDRGDVLAVWYRVDAPSSVWRDVERRIREEVVAAASRIGDEAKALLPSGGDRLGLFLRDIARKMRSGAGSLKQVVVFIDQLERTFESGDEPDQERLQLISGEIINLLKTVKVGEGVRIFIASRKQYLPDFLRSFQAAADSGLHFNVLQTISEQKERTGFVEQVLTWAKRQNLVEERVAIDKAAAETLASRVNGHPLNMMLALIQLLSTTGAERVTNETLDRTRPWERVFDLDLRVLEKDDIDWNFVLAMAHARTEIVRFEEVWWRLRLVDPKLTRRVDELRPHGVLERLWLLGHLGRTMHTRAHEGDPARFLEFFHANLRDYLLREVTGQAGADLSLARRRRRLPEAWRALDRLSAFAHEWEQTQQQLPADDVRVLMEHRDVVVEKVKSEGETEREPFHLLFLRDVETSRHALCTAAKECLVFSALVHDDLGRWAFDTLFPEIQHRIDCCRKWLRRCPAESRAAILRYAIEMKAPAAREFITSIALPQTDPIADGLAVDLAQTLSEPLHAARFRHEVLAAVVEKAITTGPAARPLEALLAPVAEFITAACGANRNDLVTTLSHIAKRLEGSQDEGLHRYAGQLATTEVIDEWLAKQSPAAGLNAGLDLRERHGRIPPAVELKLGTALTRDVTDQRAARWRLALVSRLGVPLPPFEVAAGEVGPNELELRLRGEPIALGTFHAGRTQILKRHWDRTQPHTPHEAYETQNDALQEVVLWVDPALLAQLGWELPAPDFDAAVENWLEEMLRTSIHKVFDFDLLIEFVNDIATVLDSSRLFHGVSLPVLRQVLLNLLHEGVPLTDRRKDIVEELQQVVNEVRDPEILTQKLREHVKDDLCRTLADDAGQLATLVLAEAYENQLSDQVRGSDDGRVLRLDPARASALAAAVRRHFERNLREDVRPVVVCASMLRRPLSRLLRRFDPRIDVLSFTELSSEIVLVPAGLVEEPKPLPV